MTIAEHWSDAMPIDTYVAQLWRKHRKRFTHNRERTTITPSIHDPFAGKGLRLLVLTEPYCEDSSQLVPVVWRLAQEVDDLELRVRRQSEHPDLAARYPTGVGHPAIPVFILMDSQLDELGSVIERPQRVSAEIVREIRRFQDEHPTLAGVRRSLDRMPEETQSQVKQHIAEWRDSQQERWAGYLLEDLAGMIREHGATAG